MVPALQATLHCVCPRCGKGKLFAGPLKLRASCTACGLDFSKLDVGDGFVVPTLMVLGFAVVGAAIWVDFTYEPPLWVHALLWPPVVLGGTLLMTRYLKAFFSVQQFNTRRSELGL